MSQDRDSLLVNSNVNPSSSSVYLDSIDTLPDDTPHRVNGSTCPPLKGPQIWAAFTATLSALSAGLVLGWTSPLFDYLSDGKYNQIKIDKIQMGWIGSFATLGAMIMCIPIGFICDLIGRKYALLSLIVPFSIGWSLIFWAKHVVTLYFGRLITGMAVGASCVAAPLYIGEIVHQNLRGALGSLFQLMIITGVFIAYLIGELISPEKFTAFCAGMPVVYVILFAFQPETPSFLIKKEKYEEAKRNLTKLRGAGYDVSTELAQIEGSLKENSQSVISLRQTFCQKPIFKAGVIALALMFFQQFTGINVIILYSSNIIKSTGIQFDSNVATTLAGLTQVVATLFASLIIEKTGRKLLLFISLSTVAISAALLAIYFSLKNRLHVDNEVLKDIEFIPIGAICLFVVAFSIGAGPIPWLIASEILPTEVRSIVGSVAGTFNWFLAFVITKTYLNLAHILGDDVMFYLFSGLSVGGTVFVVTLLPETKGKTVAQIQEKLSR